MKRKLLYFSLLVFLNACGGDGGESLSDKVPFSISVSDFSFSTDEDIIYEGILNATSNENTTISFEYTEPNNGSLVVESSGSFKYTPNLNFFGTDSFEYRAYASPQDEYSNEGKVNISVNSVDDSPEFNIIDPPLKTEIIFLEDGINSLEYSISDIDTDLSDISYSVIINDETFSVSVNQNDSNKLNLNLSDLKDAGRFLAEIIACSSDNACTSVNFETYFATGLRTIDQHQAYNLQGSYDLGSNDPKNIHLMILGDSINSENLQSFRDQITENINSLLDGPASKYFDGFFNVLVVEPFEPNGSSFIDLAGDGECVDWSENLFCWDTQKLSELKELIFPEINPTYTAIVTAVDGRGVRQGNTTVQEFGGWRDASVFRHELGHMHAVLGDTYDSGGEREYSPSEQESQTSRFTNITTESDPSNLAWSHRIEDLNNVPGFHQNAGNSGIGHFEGTYYGNSDTYRAHGYSLMGASRCSELPSDGCPNGLSQEERASLDYLPQFVESFSLESLYKMVSSTWSDDSVFLTQTEGEVTTRTGWRMGIGIESNQNLDFDKYSIEWYKDYVLMDGTNNQREATFNRPETDKWVSYTWKIKDNTGLINVPDLLNSGADCYEGLFDLYGNAIFLRSADNEWTRINDGRTIDLNNGNYSDFTYGLHRGCGASGTIMINWEKFQ